MVFLFGVGICFAEMPAARESNDFILLHEFK
jgi:hypothetical protein